MLITSPPYWGLRDYGLEAIIFDGDPGCEHGWGNPGRPHHPGQVEQTKWKSAEAAGKGQTAGSGQFCSKCGAWRGQLGLEPNPELYIQHLMQGFTEAKRVLKSTGSCWVNLGDTCHASQAGNKTPSGISQRTDGLIKAGALHKRQVTDVPSKCLCLIPERFVMAMVESGWILRNRICWHKPNPMPSSVKDRFTNTWEYLFFFVKAQKYFFDLDAVREPHRESSINRIKHGLNHKHPNNVGIGIPPINTKEMGERFCNPAGKNPGDFFEITTQPFPEAHFATFPEKLLEKPIKAGCPQWICKKCGRIRERITEKLDFGRAESKSKYNISKTTAGSLATKRQAYRKAGFENPPPPKTIGFTDCGCNAGWEGCVVLDPFMGSGTTAKVARKYFRNYMGFELNPEYIKIAEKRLAQGTLPML